MATKKDLVEAYSFSRRRLITAFVSGAPGGREVEPARPGRAIIGGVALAVLLVAGAAVLGILKVPVDIDWDQEDVVSEKGTSADFAVLPDPDNEGEVLLRPLANVTSAMLLFGSDVEAREVPSDEIAKQTRGPGIGILDAPATPPTTDNLIQTGWTACTGVDDATPVGVKVTVEEEADVEPTPDVSFVVATPKGQRYLIAESSVGAVDDRATPRAYAYPIPRNVKSVDTLLSGLTAVDPSEDTRTVPSSWVSLFPSGGELSLASFGLTPGQVGKPWPSAATLTGQARKAKIGDVLMRDGVDGDLLLLPDGDLLQLTGFAALLYDNIRSPQKFAVDQAPGPDINNVADLPNVNWPESPTGARPVGQLCALLDVGEGALPGVVLARTEDDSDASATGLDADEVDVLVESGHGAMIVRGEWNSPGGDLLVLLEERGQVHQLAGTMERDNLGYGEVGEVAVPDEWLDLFDVGVPLSIEAAQCPPTSTRRPEEDRQCADLPS